MGANESISPVGSHRSVAAKRISSQSGKLARRCLRTDSQGLYSIAFQISLNFSIFH